MKRWIMLLTILGALFVMAPSASAYVNLNGCRLHVVVPTWPGGTQLQGRGYIDSCNGNKHLQVQVCLEKWVGYWTNWACWTSAHFYSRQLYLGQNVDANAGYYRDWVWGDVNGAQATYLSTDIYFRGY